jgi:hypothetical protein
MDWHGILVLLRAVAATIPAEIREVEEGVTDFLKRVGTNARLHENKTKKQLISDQLLLNFFSFFCNNKHFEAYCLYMAWKNSSSYLAD